MAQLGPALTRLTQLAKVAADRAAEEWAAKKPAHSQQHKGKSSINSSKGKAHHEISCDEETEDDEDKSEEDENDHAQRSEESHELDIEPMSLTFDTMFAKTQAIVVADKPFDKAMMAFRRFFEGEDETGQSWQWYLPCGSMFLWERNTLRTTSSRWSRCNLAGQCSPSDVAKDKPRGVWRSSDCRQCSEKDSESVGSCSGTSELHVDDIGSNKAKPMETYLDGLMATLNLVCAATSY